MGNNGSNFLYSLLFTLYSLSERKWLQKRGTHTAYWREKDLYSPPPFFLPSGDRFSLHANLRKCQTHICVTKPKKTYQSVNPYISFTILSVSYFSKLIWLRLSLFFKMFFQFISTNSFYLQRLLYHSCMMIQGLFICMYCFVFTVNKVINIFISFNWSSFVYKIAMRHDKLADLVISS